VFDYESGTVRVQEPLYRSDDASTKDDSKLSVVHGAAHSVDLHVARRQEQLQMCRHFYDGPNLAARNFRLSRAEIIDCPFLERCHLVASFCSVRAVDVEVVAGVLLLLPNVRHYVSRSIVRMDTTVRTTITRPRVGS